MGILDVLLGRSAPVSDALKLDAEPREKFIVDETAVASLLGPNWVPDGTNIPTRPGRVSREDALSVPAIKRARDIICGTAAYLPLEVRNAQLQPVESHLFLTQPEKNRPRSVTFSMTYEDLFFDNVSYWRITEREGRINPRTGEKDGFPRWAEYLSPDRVTENQHGTIYVDGNPAPKDIIKFTAMFPKRRGRGDVTLSAEDGILYEGARAIRTLLALDDTAKRYAESPTHQGYFTPNDGIDPADIPGLIADTTDLTPAEIDELSATAIQDLLTAWAQARRTNVTAYVPASLKYVQTSYTAVEIGLKEQRSHAILEIARLTGLDASYLNSAPDGKPETYANSEQKRQDLIDLTLAQYLYPVEQRLSMGDVTPRGQEVKYNFDGFLRGDTKTRMEAYALGITTGAYTEDEIRVEEGKAPLTPTQKLELEDRRNLRRPREIQGEVVSND
jgi:hypothetical protein